MCELQDWSSVFNHIPLLDCHISYHFQTVITFIALMYYIGETRTLTTKSKLDGIHVIINDTISGEQIDLSPERWKTFRMSHAAAAADVTKTRIARQRRKFLRSKQIVNFSRKGSQRCRKLELV